MAFYELRLNDAATVVTAAGSWSGNTERVQGGIAGIRVRPATASTVYDVTIVEYDGFTVYRKTGYKGELVEDLNTPIPVRGILTVRLQNATANEAFTVKLMVAP